MKKDDIAIFICEDDDTSREIVGKYFHKERVNYVEFLPAKKRKDIVEFLKSLEED